MPKSSKEQIIEDEKKIITELQKNSKSSIDNIAKNCGCSRQKVWRIIKRLEENKTIWGYRAVIDDEMTGVKRYQILIKKKPAPMSKKIIEMFIDKKINERLEKFNVKFECSFYTQGYYDWSICLTAPSIVVLKKFIELLNSEFGDFISDIQVLEVVFPLLKGGFDNPNTEDIKDFF